MNQPTASTEIDHRSRARAALVAARGRMLDLLGDLDDDVLRAQHSPLMSPLVWDLAHVGNYEEIWLLRALGGGDVRPDIDDLYDAFRQPRADRPTLPLLSPAETRAYLDEVRIRVLDLLDADDAPAGAPSVDRLRRDAFVHAMVAQHEQQHIETMLATLCFLPAPGLRPPLPPRSAPLPVPAAEVFIPGSSFRMGTDDAWAYDNERPPHDVEVAAFWIDTTPVTNATLAGFIAAGGYDDPAWWTEDGWAWRHEADLRAPQYWSPSVTSPSGWEIERFGHTSPMDPAEPVQHVCWYEADACARWLGRRLPTEAEWEKAAAWNPVTGATHRFPWGDDETDATTLANLGGRNWGPEPVGSRPAGASPSGVLGMLGDVWEWTSTDFAPHPGFEPFPYDEYSDVFFGNRFKVLRGGSWATDPVAVRTTFRNWDFPIRRQIFSGFRCARDA